MQRVGLSILYVCTGNVCRSPMAELLLRAWVAPGTAVTVSSAGMGALVGEGIDGSSASALGQLGIDPSHHRARQFEAPMALRADLILTAERSHRDQIMAEVPAAFRRTFTMKEFARLARHVPPDDPHRVVARLAALRGVDGAVPAAVDEVPDPYRGRVQQARLIAAQVTDTVHKTMQVLDLPASDAAAAPDSRRPTPKPVPRIRPRPYRS